MLAETDLDTVCARLEASGPRSASIDSVQTCRAASWPAPPAASARCARWPTRILAVAKRQGMAVLLVGHVTKEGALAGPRVLEHLVDCVLQFEGERERTYRTLRARKNRFGSTNDVGVFEMRAGGLVEVAGRLGAVRRRGDARARQRRAGRDGGLAAAAGRGAGARLAVRARAAAAGLHGIDRNRLALVLAVLARHAGVGVGSADVFVNVAGGVRVDEPAPTSRSRWPWPAPPAASRSAAARRRSACFGEVGLTGELRSVAHPERRLAEAGKFGLAPVVSPAEAPTLRAAVRAALRPGSGRPARDMTLLRALVLATVTLALAAAPAWAGPGVDQARAALADDPVYVDSDAERAIDAGDERRVEATIADAGAGADLPRDPAGCGDRRGRRRRRRPAARSCAARSGSAARTA